MYELPPEKLDRLPKWAQEHFTSMKAHIENLNEEIDAFGWQDEKPKTELFLRRSKTRGSRVGIWEYLPLDRYVDCFHMNNVYLSATRDRFEDGVEYVAEIRSNERLLMEPRASNVCRVRSEEH